MLMLVLLVLSSSVRADQPPAVLSDVSGQIDQNGGFSVITKVASNLVPYATSTKLFFRMWAAGGATSQAYTSVSPNSVDLPKGLFSFQVGAPIANSDQIEYYVQIQDAENNTVALSPHYQLSLSAQHSIIQLQSQNKAKDDTIDGLNTQITKLKAELSGNLPSTIGPAGDGIISDQTAFFHLTTDRWGKIRIAAVRVDNGSTDATFVSPDIARDHAVKLTGLNPDHDYKLIGWILDHLSDDKLNQTNAIQLGDQYHQLKFHTLPSSKPATLVIKDPVVTANSILIPVDLMNGFLTVECSVLTDPLRDEYRKVDSRGSVTIDPFGVVMADKIESPLVFGSLQPDTQYKVTLWASNVLGERAPPETRIVRTKPLPPAFNFTGSVKLDLSISGFTATWNASSPPSSGSFEVDFGDGKPIVSQAALVTGNQLTATLDVGGLQQLFARSLQKQPSESSPPLPPPALHFKMTNSNKVQQEESIVFSYVVPTQQAVTTAKNSQIITDQQAQALQNVVRGVGTNRSFSWKDLLSTGLGILLKI